MKHQEAKARLLSRLSSHVGENRAMSMAELFEDVYQRPVQDRINDTRELRKLITSLRLEGVPIASAPRPEGGGYYLVGVGSELEDFLSRVRRRGLRALILEAQIRRISLPELLSQMLVNVKGGNLAAAK